MDSREAKFGIGQIVRHRVYPFRGVIFDVDPVFGNTEEWYEAIPAHLRPSKDQAFSPSCASTIGMEAPGISRSTVPTTSFRKRARRIRENPPRNPSFFRNGCSRTL